MAETAHTITRLPHKNDAAVAAAARDLEGDICDVADFSGILEVIVDRYLTQPGAVTLEPEEMRHIAFCAYETQRAAERCRKRYYAAIEGI